MRALAYFGQGDVHFTKDLKEPTIEADDELMIDISWCGICGTDLKEYTEGAIFFPNDGECHQISGEPLPQAMGHEMAGVVSRVGPGVKKFKVGDHVVVEPTGTCKDRYRWKNSPSKNDDMCNACKKGYYNICSKLGLCGAGVQSGGFAERVVMNESHCHKVPDDLPLDIAALIQPIAVCWHALRICNFKKGSSALVVGSGPIGLGIILALHGHGCTDIVVSEPAKIRRDFAKELGATVFDPSSLPTHEESIKYLRSIAPGGDGFDYTFDCSGNQYTFNASIECLTFNGTAVNVAMWNHKPIQFFPMAITSQEKRYMGSMCYTAEDFEAVIAAFESRSINWQLAEKLITGKVPIERGVDDAILQLLHNKEHTVKILLTPNNNNELGNKKSFRQLGKL
ncbi:hypothetical protein TBLA_0A04290 [Henningerozyma blattae CBS 6284]|uniref:Enoyl reductase (ER) domain-containing protein n=1 Tax=Henningerozyma blattae (strain ATCC 34711 / CBS 6284 / DSM 70876 / NBRC 10599 / NRRL Y-10934 / UCD 77-7) TaxID=1071380 RepID=I2GVS2_HENB6|nr:hypothetical protein TBLA_0A04290 [Tetrapisispora blattae CBS 6284]CCH58224.1 hypothetical protein TBLA_0A04290 [Tetrapisispora blattae CBS 6284]